MATTTLFFPIDSFGLTSAWTCSGGAITSGPSTASATKEVQVTGIPSGATVTGTVLAVTCGGVIGGASILTAGGVSLAHSADNVVPLDGLVTQNDFVNIVFRFKDRGVASLSDGNHSSQMKFTELELRVTYEDSEPAPTPDEPDDPRVETEGSIVLYSGWEKDFGHSLGICVLTPAECTVSEQAGGEYSLTMTHPMTEDGRWKQLVPWAIIRCPVPAADTPPITADDSGIIETWELWRANAGGAGFYKRGVRTLYPAWQTYHAYKVGDRITRGGMNYECVYAHTSWAQWYDYPWVAIGDGFPTSVRTLPEWTRFLAVTYNRDFLRVRLTSGEYGYVKISEATYIRTATAEDMATMSTDARVIGDQPFRITDVTVDSAAGTVTVNAQHVSYDYSFGLLGEMTLEESTLPDAVLDVRSVTLPDIDAAPAIYCEATGRTITGTYTGKNHTSAILDPDIGFVAQAHARLVRDGWDFFLLANTPTDRGYRIVHGVNLLGVTWTRDFRGMVTRVMPVAKNRTGGRLLLDDVFVDSEYVDNYPIQAFEQLKVDGQVGKEGPDGQTWTEETLKAKMLEEAQKRFTEDHADMPAVELEVDFVMLGQTEEYKQYRALERVSLYDTVTVTHPDLGLDTAVQVKGYTWDAIRRRFNSISLGDVFDYNTNPLSGYEISDSSITVKKLTDAAIEEIRGS